jgi:hypothetical protein
MKTHNLKGIKLFDAVFDEISKINNDDSVSTVDLMLAAQQLIKISKKEYSNRDEVKQRSYSDYYSHEVDTAFNKYQKDIFKTESNYYSDQDNSDSDFIAFSHLCQASSDSILGGIYA